jgi:protein-L-isoaspartate(D-aspartate) O-methyltransferase
MGPEELVASLRRRGLEPRVVEAFGRVDRARFVPADLQDRAWEDGALPLAAGQTISQPSLVAYMAALLDVRPGDRVLDVGTGSGYHAAVLAQLAAEVYSVELHAELAEAAQRNLRATGCDNVTVKLADGTQGLPEHAPFDAINVAAAVEATVPPALLEQLADGGRLVAPVRNGEERLVVIRRRGEQFERSDHGAVRFVPLLRREAG